MTQYRVDVIGETCCDKDFDALPEAFDHMKHLLEDGKKLEISVLPEVPVEAPVEGEGAPATTEPSTAPVAAPDSEDTEDTDDVITAPSDALAEDADAEDELDDDELSGEEIDAGLVSDDEYDADAQV